MSLVHNYNAIERMGAYRGWIAAPLCTEEARAALLDLPRRTISAGEDLAPGGRHIVRRLELPCGEGATRSVVVKTYGPQIFWKDILDARRGTKAFRASVAACALTQMGVGTPEPLAFLDRWEGGRLKESHLVTAWAADTVSFRDEFNRLFRENPDCARLMDLLHVVADAVAAMHAAGVVHFDLGNQNILLRRTSDGGWRDPLFIDLNRARVRKRGVSLRDRARDISRLDIPSDLLRVFLVMYFGERHPPGAFIKAERHYRERFAWHTRTRRWRHPVRESWGRSASNEGMPTGRDLWIWDERSGQAIPAFTSRDRRKYYDLSHGFDLIRAAPRLPALYARTRIVRSQAFSTPVNMAGRVGVAVDPQPETWQREINGLIKIHPGLPTLMRVYHHRSDAVRAWLLASAEQLHAQGHPVSLALVQDRGAVKNPGSWRNMVETTMATSANWVDWVEVGHAFNRVKWGLWNNREYLDLLRPIMEGASSWPAVKWMGPAGIDFEYHYVVALLNRMGADFRFHALSHLLYVDRRGAPENFQRTFSLVEKLALMRAMADISPACENRLIISEANWPLLGTGVWSPVGSPYETPGPRRNDPSVSEDEYAWFMIRYIALALCSGLVERIYWWRLAAHGYGLIDDRNGWRPRPAFDALAFFVRTLGTATFTTRTVSPPGTHVLIFQHSDGRTLWLAWSFRGAIAWTPPEGAKDAFDITGHKINTPTHLTGSPVYLQA